MKIILLIQFELRLKKEDECCKIVVQDNGQGINAAMLEKINSFINDEDYLLDDDDHIGLHNVISRIRLVYNDHAIVNVTSKPGRGYENSYYDTCGYKECIKL